MKVKSASVASVGVIENAYVVVGRFELLGYIFFFNMLSVLDVRF